MEIVQRWGLKCFTNLGGFLVPTRPTAADRRDVDELIGLAGAEVGEYPVVGQRVLIGARGLLPVRGGLPVRVVLPDLKLVTFITILHNKQLHL